MLINCYDNYSRTKPIDSRVLRDILDKLDNYFMQKELEYRIIRIEETDYTDINKRIDIEVLVYSHDVNPKTQKLFILKDELLDGNEFHKRFKKFYP